MVLNGKHGQFVLWGLIFFIGLTGSLLQAESKLDVGADYRIRGISLSNRNLKSSLQDNNLRATEDLPFYSSQRARVYIKGKFDPSLEVATVLGAVGLTGTSQALLGRYPNENFTPFVENAYVRTNEVMSLPLSIVAGRQPYTWGTGMLLSDDGLGFDGISLDIGPYWGSLHGYLMMAKTNDKLVGDKDSTVGLAGASYQWGIHNIRIGYIMEQNKSGARYSNLSSTTPVTSNEIERQFADIQISGQLEQGAYYVLEYARQMGKARLPDGSVTLSGDALTFEGGFDFYHPRYKRMILAGVYAQGSGDDFSTTSTDERFHPSFGHKYDGLERSGYGDFFAATPYSFFNEDKSRYFRAAEGNTLETYTLDKVFSGLRIWGFKGSINPWDPFVAGLEFYTYSALEVAKKRTGEEIVLEGDGTGLGRELVLSLRYTYAKRITFGFRWGQYFSSTNTGGEPATRLILEAGGKF